MAAVRCPLFLTLACLAILAMTSPAHAAGIPSWEWVGPASSNIGGRVRAISIDPTNGNNIVVGAAVGGIWRTTNAGATWAPVNDFLGSLAISSLTRDLNNSQTMYAGTGEGFLVGNSRLDGKTPGVGILKSTNGGSSWSPLIGTIGWAADAGDKFVNRVLASGSVILAATNDGIRRSEDGGISFDGVYEGWATDLKWTRPPGGSLGDAAVAGMMVCDDITCPNNSPAVPIVCALYSDDEGATWTPSTFTGVSANPLTIAAAAGSSSLTLNTAIPYRRWDIVKIGSNPGEYKQVANNGSGTTLTLRTPLANAHPAGTPVVLVPSQRTELAVVKNFPNVVYAAMGAGGGTIWKSSDGGRTFRFVSNPPWRHLYGDSTSNNSRALYDNAIWASPNDSNVVVIAGVMIYRSTDGGATFQDVADERQVLTGGGPHIDFHAIVEHPSYASGVRTVYVGNDGGIQRTPDMLAPTPTWQTVTEGLGVTQFYGGAATRSGGVEWYMGGGQDNGRPHLRRNTADPLQPDGWVKPFDDDLNNGGANGLGDDKYAVAIDDTDPQNPVLYALGVEMRVYRSLDQGDTWTNQTPTGAFSEGQTLSPFVLDPSNRRVLYAGTTSLYRSTNRADSVSWAEIKGVSPGSPFVAAIDVAPSDSNVVWIGYSNGNVAYTRNARAATPTWFPVGLGIVPARAITDLAIDPQNPGRVFVTFVLPPDASDPLDDVWYTADWGACWTNRSGLPGLQHPRRPVLTVRVHPTDPDRVFLGTGLGVIASHDGGLSWNQNPLHAGTYASEGPANLEIYELLWQANEYLVAATNGRGMFRALPTPRTPLFTDISTSSGTADPGNGQGVAWGDYDRDGDLDLYVANHSNQADKLFRNNGAGSFTDVSSAAGINDALTSIGAVWGDYDNDGDLDLYVTNHLAANRLYRNNGNSTFTDVATAAGVADPASQGRGAAWADYDRDGRLDLYVVNVGPNRLFRNLGNGTFTDVTSGPLGDAGSGQGCAWGDYDNDGDPDLYVANWTNQADKLLRNDGGAFTDVSATTGIADTSSSLGGAWGDYDNDGDLDLYVANESGPNRLFRNNGNLTFTDVAAGANSGNNGKDARGVTWGDVDNDGDLDLFIANFNAPSALLRQEACGVFLDATTIMGTGGTSSHRGAALGDIDADGDLDLHVSRSGANQMFRNAAPSYHHWLHVDLVGVRSNRDGIGARVKVVTGTRTQIREVSGGSGLYSQESLTAEFGLGTATIADQIEVRWPSGVVQTVTNVTGDQRITLTEPGPTDAPDRLPPSAFALEPPVPNPFSHAVTIRFALPVPSNVRLEVYDLSGRRVRTLVRGTREAGIHQVEWGGDDDSGRSAGAGIYFVRFEAPGFTATRRAMHLR